MGKSRVSKNLRRTTSLVKRAFFDIIGERIQGSRFLDLYAGEGGVGMEALKRGASFALFVESSKRHGELILKRLRDSSLSEKGRVTMERVEDFLSTYRHAETFDIVFADPPYESLEYEVLERSLPEFTGISDDTIICIEHFHKKILPEEIGSLVLLKRYRYGDTILSFYRRKQ